jgi:hypothetical protein
MPGRHREIYGRRIGRVDLERHQLRVVEQIVAVAGRLDGGPPKTAAGLAPLRIHVLRHTAVAL